MVQMGVITQAMLKQHSVINKNLLDFEKISREDTIEFVRLFNAFKWNLNKHIFIEEENIFPIADRNNKTELRQLQTLLNEHKDIRKIIDNLEEEIIDGRKPNTSILRELLFAHEGREIEGFYPLLDTRLSNEQKKTIMEKLKDVKLG